MTYNVSLRHLLSYNYRTRTRQYSTIQDELTIPSKQKKCNISIPSTTQLLYTAII